MERFGNIVYFDDEDRRIVPDLPEEPIRLGEAGEWAEAVQDDADDLRDESYLDELHVAEGALHEDVARFAQARRAWRIEQLADFAARLQKLVEPEDGAVSNSLPLRPEGHLRLVVSHEVAVPPVAPVAPAGHLRLVVTPPQCHG
jgi:hypothetical protein